MATDPHVCQAFPEIRRTILIHEPGTLCSWRSPRPDPGSTILSTGAFNRSMRSLIAKTQPIKDVKHGIFPCIAGLRLEGHALGGYAQLQDGHWHLRIGTIKSIWLQSPALAANWRLAAWIAARFCLAQRPRRLTGSSKECPSFVSS